MALSDIKVEHKAPRGTMYLISGISFVTVTSASVFVLIFDTLMGFRVTDNTTRRSSFASYSPNAVGNNYFIGNINHQTKFVTVIKSGGAQVNVDVHFYGEFVKVSRKRLLIEWFKRFG